MYSTTVWPFLKYVEYEVSQSHSHIKMALGTQWEYGQRTPCNSNTNTKAKCNSITKLLAF